MPRDRLFRQSSRIGKPGVELPVQLFLGQQALTTLTAHAAMVPDLGRGPLRREYLIMKNQSVS